MDQNLNKNIIEQIKSGELKMKPKGYFVLGNILSIFGVVSLSILSTFTLNLFFYRMRMGRFMEKFSQVPFTVKIKALLIVFPWEFLMISAGALVIGVYLVRKFDEGYKKSYSFLVTLALAAILLTAVVIDKSGINDQIRQKRPFREFYQNQREIPEFRKLQQPGNQIPRRFDERNLPPRMY